MPTWKVVQVELLSHVADEARKLARASELPLSRWIAETIEVAVAGERCSHHPPPSAPPTFGARIRSVT